MTNTKSLAVEIEFARKYAGPEAADRAETLVREYAAAWGVPERRTTSSLARDAAEDGKLR